MSKRVFNNLKLATNRSASAEIRENQYMQMTNILDTILLGITKKLL